jgi:hypothetical protein
MAQFRVVKQKNVHALLYGNLWKGPLNASVSPGFKLWMYTDATPFGYFFTRKVNSPGKSEGEMGV